MSSLLNNLSPTEARRRRRPAYILIVVLGLTAVVITLGWAFLDAHSTVAPGAVNWLGYIRAQYLAESGVALGAHFLMYPPTTVSCTGYWTGGTNIAIDGTSDYVNVSLTRGPTDRNQFTITATGVAHNPDGTVRGKHTVTAVVLRPTDGKWHLCQAYLGAGNDPWMPSTVRINGDLHVNGTLVAAAACPGNVSTTSWLSWSGSGPPASTTEYAPALVLPTTTVSNYRTYSIGGTTYSATNYTNQDMTSANAAALNALSLAAGNIGRVFYRNGDLRLKNGVNLNGTLVVNGNLRFDANNIVVTAQPNFPALVVTGYIYFEDFGDKGTINGSVICGGGIWDNNTAVYLDITGTLITGWGFSAVGGADQFNITWNADRSTFWDFEYGTGQREPMTYLSWSDG